MSAAVTDIAFAPLLPWWTLALAALAAAALLLHGLARGAPGMAWRALVLATVLAILANPSVVRERRESLPDVAVVVVDRSASQSIGERPRQTEEALAAMTERLGRLDGLELRVVEAGPEPAGADGAGPGSGTRLFAAARRAIADLPRGAVSGLLLLTDGQVHDAPRDSRGAGARRPGARPVERPRGRDGPPPRTRRGTPLRHRRQAGGHRVPDRGRRARRRLGSR